jgi:5'-nucleotidase
MKKPLILVTNDDGIAAPGLKALVEVAKEIGEVVVIAPDSPQSAKGHAITISGPIRLNKVEVFEGIESYECSGTPVDSVKLGKYVVLRDREVDLCVSGINHGSNASINIIYSGTVSAAMEASFEGINSIAFSLLDFSWEADFEASKPYIKQIIEYALTHNLPRCKLLNVNIPKLPFPQIKGIRICRQADGRWEEDFLEAVDPRGIPYYWMSGKFNLMDLGEDTDIWALENGYISVVPSGHDLTKHDAIAELKTMEIFG